VISPTRLRQPPLGRIVRCRTDRRTRVRQPVLPRAAAPGFTSLRWPTDVDTARILILGPGSSPVGT